MKGSNKIVQFQLSVILSRTILSKLNSLNSQSIIASKLSIFIESVTFGIRALRLRLGLEFFVARIVQE
jgi:hypothetical protein